MLTHIEEIDTTKHKITFDRSVYVISKSKAALGFAGRQLGITGGGNRLKTSTIKIENFNPSPQPDKGKSVLYITGTSNNNGIFLVNSYKDGTFTLETPVKKDEKISKGTVRIGYIPTVDNDVIKYY